MHNTIPDQLRKLAIENVFSTNSENDFNSIAKKQIVEVQNQLN